MKYLLLLLLSSFILFSQPKIIIDGGDVINFGSMKHSDEVLKSKVKILNIGNDTLKIYDVKPGCGCTTAPLDKKLIEPNGYAVMDISLSLPNNQGKFSKNIDIFSNDPVDSLKVIWLKLEVIFPISFFPQKGIKMGNMALDANNTGKVIIKNSTKEKIYIKQLEVEPSDLLVNIKNEDFIPPQGQLIIEATYKPKSVGQFIGSIKFKTTEPSTPRVEIPVVGVTY